MEDATLTTVAGRSVLRFEREIGYSASRVWRAISVPGELGQWFPAAAEWGPTAGEQLEAGGMTGEVTRVEREALLEWEFAGSGYLFELAPHGEGTRLVFEFTFEDRATAAQTAAGWEAYLRRLEPLLAGTPLDEMAAHDGWEGVHERYAERFQVDPAPGRAFAERLRGNDG